MKEKQIKARPGMPILILSIVLYIAAIVLVVLGGILLEDQKNIGALPLALGTLWLILGTIPFVGLKVLKPNEALVLTLFGKYTGTLREAGFFLSIPFRWLLIPLPKPSLDKVVMYRPANKASPFPVMEPRWTWRPWAEEFPSRP